MFRIVRQAEFVAPGLFRWYYRRFAEGYVRGLRRGQTSAAVPLALKVAHDMSLAAPDLGAILLVGASRESYVINYRNGTSSRSN